jgi:hypothetical protein
MAAGLGFKTFLSGDVLSAGDVNGYLMQGINVFATTAARDAAITAPQEGQFAFTKDTNSLWYYDSSNWVASGATGDIEGVTAGIGISGGGTSGTVTVTNSMATAIDAKGDLVAGTGADAFSKLTVGANDTVLTADSAQATGLKWSALASGGMTSLASGSLSSSSLTISSISGDYKDLQLVIRNYKTTTDGATLKLRINGDTNTRYRRFLTYGNSGALAFDATDIQFVAGQSNVNSNGLNVMEIPDYANALTWKTCNWVSANDQDSSGGGVQNNIGYGVYNQAAAITSLTLTPSGGTMSGTYILYGVK